VSSVIVTEGGFHSKSDHTRLTESHCIRCLQAFKFLVNIKRQCLDCQLYVCRSCSHFNKNEQGWLCDPCHMSSWIKNKPRPPKKRGPRAVPGPRPGSTWVDSD
uniref:FYVE-type zinc finger domain-containing protein n=1 Tax=Oryzias latipes TaxID=8090 RepID=A0A3P9LKP0_ORYLA